MKNKFTIANFHFRSFRYKKWHYDQAHLEIFFTITEYLQLSHILLAWIFLWECFCFYVLLLYNKITMWPIWQYWRVNKTEIISEKVSVPKTFLCYSARVSINDDRYLCARERENNPPDANITASVIHRYCRQWSLKINKEWKKRLQLYFIIDHKSWMHMDGIHMNDSGIKVHKCREQFATMCN